MSLSLQFLLRLWPRDFRDRHGIAVQAAARDQWRHLRRLHGEPMATLRMAPRLVVDIIATAARLRRDQIFGSPPDPLGQLPRPENNRMDSILQDLRYGARYLLRTPGVSLVAIVALALGIGANTVIFSLVHGILLQPMPFESPEQLVHVWESHAGRGWDTFTVSPQNYRDIKEQARSFSAMTGLYGLTATITGDGGPERVSGALVADDFFQTLGAELALGRGFQRDEHSAGTNKVVVLSPGFWQRRFGGSPDVLDEELIINGETHRIVGVLADPASGTPRSAELWAPIDLDSEFEVPRGAHWWRVIGRLEPGIEVARAAEEVGQIADRLPLGAEGWSATAVSMHSDITDRASGSLQVLFGAVGLVLLIACANVANLLLARSSARARELSLRNALGASRGRLFRQVMVESLLLAFAGAAAGLGVAYFGLRAVLAAAGNALPRLDEVALDGTVLAFTIGIATLTGLIFGVLPAWRGGAVPPADALKEGSAATGDGRERTRLRSALVVGEVALAVTVIGVAGLLTRSLVTLQSVDPGFAVENRVTARLSLPDESYPDRPSRIAFYDSLVDELRGNPTVIAADLTMSVPLTGDYSVSFDVVGRETPEGEPQPSAEIRVVGPAYFDTMAIPLLRGRAFSRADRPEVEHVVVVNEAFAQRFFGDEDPIGAMLDIGFGVGEEGDPRERRIVGVVGNTKAFNLGEADRPLYYLGRHQMAQSALSLVVHSEAPSDRTLALIRDTVERADPNLAVYQATTLGEIVRGSTASQRLRLGLITSFALLAMLLSGVGIYGMQSFGVNQRRREIGLRLAIGAAPTDVLRMVLRSGVGLATIGVVLGTGGAFLLGRAFANQLYGVTPHDPATLAGVAAGVVLLATVACWLPARRATRVDPASSLRAD